MRVQLDRNGAVLDLSGDPMARGGEAAIYEIPERRIGGRPMVAKIYHQPNAEKARKLAAMIANPPRASREGLRWLAWPTERLVTADSKRICVGYVMPRITPARLVFEFYNPGLRRKRIPRFNYRYLLRTARNLAGVVHLVHACGYVIGDLNENNILVTGRATVGLVDCDSWQVRTGGQVFRCPVGRPEYTAPELHSTPFRHIDRRPEHDLFALSVLIWRLLMSGTHPFDGRFTKRGDPPTVPQRIVAGCFTYASRRSVPFRPSPLAPGFRTLDKKVQQLMLACFIEGHRNPKSRPDAAAWCHALSAAERNLRRCTANPQHLFRQGLRVCPWCRQTKRIGGDPFPGPHLNQPGTSVPPVPLINHAATPPAQQPGRRNGLLGLLDRLASPARR